MINKTVTNKMPYAVDVNIIAPASADKKTIHCAVHGDVEVPSSYIVYKFNRKEFCTYTCKCKYIREHPEEREISLAEYHELKHNNKLKEQDHYRRKRHKKE